MSEIVLTIAMTAIFFNTMGYIIYCLQIKNKSSRPNATSWGLWTFIAMIDFASYEAMSGNTIASLTFLVDVFFCIGIFVHVVYQKSIQMPKWREWVIIAFVIFSILIWWIFQTAMWANLIICFASFLSFFPIIESVWKDKNSEKSDAWFVQTFAYFFMLMSVLLSGDYERVELVAPIMLMFLHALVAVLADRKKLPEGE